MIHRSGVWRVCMSGSLVHFRQVCVTNHMPYNSFALLNSSHHGVIQTAANPPACSLNANLLSPDKRNKCLKLREEELCMSSRLFYSLARPTGSTTFSI